MPLASFPFAVTCGLMRRAASDGCGEYAEHSASGCWHSSGRDRSRYPRECWLSTLGVLHPGVPVMWYGHIRDLSPTAKGCMGGRTPNVTMLHWAQQK